MTDTDLRDLLREQRRHEPAFLLDPHATIRAGRRRALVRTSAAGIATAAAVGALATVGVNSLSAGGEDPAPAATEVASEATPSPPASTPASPTPVRPREALSDYITALAASTYGPLVPAAGEPELHVSAPSGPVAESDPRAQEFVAVVVSPDKALVLRRSGQEVSSLGTDDTCELAAQYFTSCTFEPGAEGGYLLQSVGPASAPKRGGSVRLLTDDDLRRVDESDVFFRRTVAFETAEGEMAAADELVRAATAAEAEDEWRLTPEQLLSLAQDPGLAAYDLPNRPWR